MRNNSGRCCAWTKRFGCLWSRSVSATNGKDASSISPGGHKQQFETAAGRREFWEMLEIQIGQALDAFARQHAIDGQDHSFFAGETTKGLQLLEIMSRRYDVVVTTHHICLLER